jgi:hypothetical protein
MDNTTIQNPANRVGRNSGAGPGGVSEVIPTEAEARRGLEPFSIDSHPDRVRRMVGIGVAAAAGVGIAVLATLRLRRPKTVGNRIQELLPTQKQVRRTLGRIEMPSVSGRQVRRVLGQAGIPGVTPPRGRIRRLIGR